MDTREQNQVHLGTVVGALNIPRGAKASNFAAWVIDPQKDAQDLIVLAPDANTAADFRDALLRVGIDTVRYFTNSIDGLPTFVPELISPAELAETNYDALIDIRAKSEFAAGSIPGAQQLSGGSAMWRLNELPAGGTLVTFCQSGARNTVVANALRRAGFTVIELEGSYAAWEKSAANPKNLQTTV